jgi:hypothetical protein
LKPHGQIKRNFTGSIYGRFSIIYPHFIPIGQNMVDMGNSCLRFPNFLEYLIFQLLPISSADQRPFELLQSLGVCRSSVLCRKLSHFNIFPLKPLNQIKPNLAGMGSWIGLFHILCPTDPPFIQDG